MIIKFYLVKLATNF